MNPFKKVTKQLGVFVTAGFPLRDSTIPQIKLLSEEQVDFIEIGIPFSDPMADGPTIQESSELAIQNGMSLGLLFEQLKMINFKTPPLVLMGYLNPILNFGIDKFLEKCAESMVSGVIIPDISIEIYERFYQKKFESAGITCIFLITADTPLERMKQIAQHAKNGFVYLTSSNKTTGKESEFSLLDRSVTDKVRAVFLDTPVFIGFGISSKSDIRKVQEISDGAIIGSAYIEALKKGKAREFIQDIR
jgi:tryptophan synthase alpha chain